MLAKSLGLYGEAAESKWAWLRKRFPMPCVRSVDLLNTFARQFCMATNPTKCAIRTTIPARDAYFSSVRNSGHFVGLVRVITAMGVISQRWWISYRRQALV